MNANVPLQFIDLQDRFARTREQLAAARHLPGEVYAKTDVLALEKQKIFLDTWLCVGREEELPNVGDYLTASICDEPYVLTRTTSGEISAFMNMCLHRGVAIAEGRGNARDFSCPYHAWLYDLEGKLLVAPGMGKTPLDIAGKRLKPLEVRTWRGWIFMSFNREPMPFEEFIGEFAENTPWFRTDECRMAEKMQIEVACNWKLLVENLVDIYHVPVLHTGTFGRFNDYRNLDVKLHARGSWTYDQKARSHSKTGKSLFPTLPWLEGLPDDTSSRGGLFPNVTLSMRSDSLRLWQVWPIDAERTRLDIYLMFPPVAFEQPDFEANLAEYKAFVAKLVAEDASMVVSLQNAMKSPFYEPGPMSSMEVAVHHLMKAYLDAIER
ncbi:aromatic ring-hydroxylating dioxygenase subunit alpha [Caballeronia sp. LZ033]|uniref:aromatic ring-hydroxylating oxygenase subunit alpha n=1 Tax=Caballeronia sp. LZ033 TaxID=3038566 RepID=UPI00285D2F26|nr:aromatic ring-hydroxylating dioxygenase subunit alpha [Caballeronia sp. LZ033]MDR5815087.1 aromatic ring-hydroxylating dioxygenase subunit alpha [Caballeronia sp. LZ033]